jgi:hypothetical protein
MHWELLVRGPLDDPVRELVEHGLVDLWVGAGSLRSFRYFAVSFFWATLVTADGIQIQRK